jgi:hypothetical protein
MQELPASSTYHLETTITRPDVVDWLQSLPPEKLGGEVERTLAAGNLVLTMIQASTGEEAMSRFFGPIVDRMKELDGTLKEMQGKVNKSQRIGELGESLVAKQLKDAFPEDEFELTAKDGHQADIRAKFKVTSGKQCEALVVAESVCPEWHLVKGVFRGVFTSTKRSTVPRSPQKAS